MNVFVLIATAVASLFSVGRTPVATDKTPAAMLSAAQCGQCHAQEYETWRHSRHAAAWSNGLFQQDYARTPRQWCQNCHIPLAAQQAQLESDGPLVGEGVNCAACHVRDGVIHARAKRPGSPHRTRIVEDFGTPEFCAGCHQFNFPVFDSDGAFAHYSDEPMQDTVAQYRKNARNAGDPGCVRCHMSDGVDHGFPGSHSPAMLERALSLAVCRSASGALRLTVRNRGAGHNVPTGDVHRHVLVKAWRSTDPEHLREAFYGRRYAPTADGAKRTTWDSTLAPGRERTWTLLPSELGGAGVADEPINIELRYVYGTEEVPRKGFGEPAFATVTRMRRSVNDFVACSAR